MYALPGIEWWKSAEEDTAPPEVATFPPVKPGLVFGKRMEWFFKQELLASTRYELLVDNLQIIDKGITIGELDFVVLDKDRNCLVHLEMAYKFYLYDPQLPSELPRWIGPNRRDRLVNKMEKLLHRQFPLIYRPETKDALKAFSLPDLPMTQALCLKAQLFVPIDEQERIPPVVNPQAISGFWIPLSRFGEFAGNQFYLPEKHNWTIDPSVWEEWHSFEKTLHELQLLANNKRSPLCWMRNAKGEFSRFFVVWW